MPTEQEITAIRALLVRFYDGKSSEEEEKELKRFFKATPLECIPQDMLPDRALILSIASLNVMDIAGSLPLPEEVNRRFDSIVDTLADTPERKTPEASGRNPSRLKKLTAWVSAAAACVLAAWLVTGVLRIDRGGDAITSELAYTAKTEQTVSEADSVTDISVRATDTGLHTAAASHLPSVSAETTVRHDDTSDMTPEEIDAEVTRALTMMQRALGKGMSKMAEAQTDISETNRKTMKRVEEALRVDLPGINSQLRI